MKNFSSPLLAVLFLLTIPACKPTYKKETLKEDIKTLAQKEYDLDVDVEEVGKTIGVRFKVKNLLTELYSGDASIYKKMNGLFMVLARVVLSSDEAPDFIVLDIVDEDNPQFRLMFTRYEEDLRKSMAEALSFTQSQDRLLEEFVINGRRVPFDPQEMDLVRLMMMAIDTKEGEVITETEFELEEVHFDDFVARVAENTMRRLLREKKDVSKQSIIREVKASFEKDRDNKNQFTILIDMVSQPAMVPPPMLIEKVVLPYVAEELAVLCKSYRFKNFSGITVIEKNSGKILVVPGT